MMTGKERVLATLEFRNAADRAPRQLWALPWAQERWPDRMRKLNEDFAWDIASPEAVLSQRTATPTPSASPPTTGAACFKTSTAE